MASLDSFKCRKTLDGRGQDLPIFFAQGGRAAWPRRRLAIAVLAEGRAGEPAAQRGRAHRQEGGHRGGRRLAGQPRQERARNRLPPGARADAGLHRRAGGRRSGRDARRDGQARRRPRQDQSAQSRRPRDRPFRRRRLFRHRQGARARTSSANTSRTRSAIASSSGASRRSPISRVVPPGTGICHQVNLEYLAQTVWTVKEKRDGKTVEVAYPDTLVGTDSHTTMVNGLAVLGWGVGGIEAEAAMLGQPLSMLLPEVIGFKLTGELREGVTATDLVLTVTQMLRKKGVVGKFVEFFGPGLNAMSVADRATLANMAPEYGATCGLFPIDAQTIAYLQTSGRKTRARRAGGGLRQGARVLSHPPDARSRLHRHARAGARRSHALARRPQAPTGPRRPRRRQGGLRRRDDLGIQAGRRDRRASHGGRARTSTSATATWSSPRSPPAPTPPTPA